MHLDLSNYSPDPVPVCPPGSHVTESERDTNAEIPTCIACGLDLEDQDEIAAWHWDQIVNNPPSENEEN